MCREINTSLIDSQWLTALRYRPVEDCLLSEYPMEQQAQIISDIFTLYKHGY